MHCLAIDIGASSGRHIVGRMENGRMHTEEVYRFPNAAQMQDGHLVWDVERLVAEVKTGVAKARAAYADIASLSIDTWGVDYVLLEGDTPITPCYAYRDGRTEAAVREVHARVPFDALYARTGIQYQPFNTIYQLYSDMRAGRLARATDFLMLPEYLLYRLTGVKKKEYTNATTTGLVHAQTGAFDAELIRSTGLPARLFPPLARPGETAGAYEGIRAVLCATHDTASAVEGIPMQENAPYISSGTWSLLGMKTAKPHTDGRSRAANYSNEGGVGYIRYQKNIMGLWIAQCLSRQLGMDFSAMAELARTSDFEGVFDVNDPRFIAPADIRAEISHALGLTRAGDAMLLKSVYLSLAHSYQTALTELETNLGIRADTLYIVGGGAKNAYLNELSARCTGKRVIALPIEATALGNLKIQWEAIQ